MTRDFSEDWQDLLPSLMTVREEKLQQQLREAAERAKQVVLEALEKKLNGEAGLFQNIDWGSQITPELVSRLISSGISLFMESWGEILKDSNLTGLVEIILEGQDLSPEELKGFIRAIPTSLVSKIVASAVGTASGTHALFALESHRRNGTMGVMDYEVLRLSNGRMAIRLPLEGDNFVMVHLNDKAPLTQCKVGDKS